MENDSIKAIVLAGGNGTRMGLECKKQYMPLAGYPLLYYSLKAFQESPVDEIVLVTNEEEYCMEEIVKKYGFDKVKKTAPGGGERYESVYHGLLKAKECDYILIHDGARPFVTQEIIRRCITEVKIYKACVVGVPVKDTIKIADEEGYALHTPNRNRVYMVQTPQVFSFPLIFQAYSKIIEEQVTGITDDAMAVEYLHGKRVKLIEGNYQNIKITTPEDLLTAQLFLDNKNKWEI